MVYEIQTYDLIGAKFFVFTEMPDYKVVKGNKSQGEKDKFFDEDGDKVESNRYREYTDDLSQFKGGQLLNKNDFPIYLPFFADVTEDLPGWAEWKPKTWTGCQLLTQKHGGYLEFFHHESGETLRIAMNSNTYKPVDSAVIFEK